MEIGKRPFIGALLCLCIAGEPTVGFMTGLFSPAFPFLFCLYFFLFTFLDGLSAKYKLTIMQLILLTFVLYAVGITGFMHKELTEFVLHPKNDLITILMRLQPSFFTVYAFTIINHISPRYPQKTVPPFYAAIGLLLVIILLSFTGIWGIPLLFTTMQITPIIGIVFIVLCILALWLFFHVPKGEDSYHQKSLLYWAYVFLVIGCIPLPIFFIISLVLMTGVTIIYLFSPGFRNALI